MRKLSSNHFAPTPGVFRSRLPLFLLGLSIFLAGAMPISAASCWRVVGWDDVFAPAYAPQAGDVANLEPTDCTVVPEGWGWAQVGLATDGEAPPDLFLQLRSSGPAINGWVGYAWEHYGWFNYSGVDANGMPLIDLFLHLCTSCPPATELLYPYPPEQAPKFWLLGKRVRLRNAKTHYCLYTAGGNGGLTLSKPCSEDPAQIFVLDHVGSGKVRLRHELDNQCLYTLEVDNSTVHHWGCWDSPVQRFQLDTTTLFGGAFRLKNIERGQCAYGNPTPDDVIRSWSCWDSQAQAFKIDRLE